MLMEMIPGIMPLQLMIQSLGRLLLGMILVRLVTLGTLMAISTYYAGDDD